MTRPGGPDKARPVSGLLENLPISARLSRSLAVTKRVAPVWEQILERKLYEHTQLAHFEDGILVVTADSPLWANLLHHQQGSLLAALREAGLTEIHHIYIRTAPRQRPDSPDRQVHHAPVSESVTRSIEIAARNIEDPEVREALDKLARSLTTASKQ